MTRQVLRARLAWRLSLALAAALTCGVSVAPAESPRLKILFLGDNGPHRPADRAADLLPALARAGIDLAWTDDLADLNRENLDRYDCLLIYANHPEIAPEQEAALFGYVESGRGLVALHCASYCFLNSPRYVDLVGGQFKSHEAGVFRPRIVAPEHPAVTGVEEFEAWDETYVHHRLTDDREVLMVREEEGHREPWTWVRRQGSGRVFYTASGHDARVFRNAGFQRLVVQGIRWAAGRPEHDFALDLPPRLPADLPNYLPGERWGTVGEPIRDMQAPLSPEESLRHISVPGGFRVELFASEPDIVNPIAVTWDDRGRAWIAESVDYPNELRPEGRGRDRITICEDTTGDGRADTFTRFADRLSIPTSLVHTGDGLIVAQAPHMLFLRDSTGDDRADVRKVLFTGFHVDDTHAGPSNLRLGLDNWVYATVGYAGFDGEVGGRRHRFRQGLFRFRPDGSELEFLASTSNNTWGLGLSETGEIFYSTANGEHSSYLAVPNRLFESVRGWVGRGTARMADHDRIHPAGPVRQVDVHGGFTAAAGHAVYTARQFPAGYWDRIAFVCEPTGRLVHMCLLEPEGSHFVARDRFNLLASTDEWTAPIAAEVGPDGAVWVLDWYNPVIQHNPTPPGFRTGRGNAYETPLRDKEHGRIYRVVNDAGEEGGEKPRLPATADELVALLQSDNMFWRLIAQWKLVARGQPDVLPALAALARDETLDELSEGPAALHALWTMHGLGAFDADAADESLEVAVQALRHPAAGVRRAAAEVLPAGERAAAALLDAGLLADERPLVRRAALLALAGMPPIPRAGEAVHDLLNGISGSSDAEDRWIPLAATAAAARHDAGFLAAALAAENNSDAVRGALRVVSEHFARGRPTEPLAPFVVRLGDASPEDAEAFLAGLAAGWPPNHVPQLDERAETVLIQLMDRLGSAGQLQLAALADRWELTERFRAALAALERQLLEEVADAGRPANERVDAARRLAGLQPERDTIERLLNEVTPRAEPELAAGILEAAGRSTRDFVGAVVIERWGQFTPRLRQQALEVLLRRPEWSRALLDGLESDVVPVGDLSAEQSQQLSAHPDEALAARARGLLARGGRLPDPDREKVLQALFPLTEERGHADRGREVFQKNCAKCHRHGDLGEEIGPNLTGFAVHSRAKILTEIIDPNRSVEGNYRQYTVVTESGRVYNGLLASETRTAVELVDNQAQRHAILREDIEEMIASDKSIMPEGFEKQLAAEELVDLLEFLAAGGKYLPLPLEGVATAVSTRGMFYRRDARPERLIFSDWSPKTFEGIPFQLVDPRGDRVPNVILLHGPQGTFPPQMPKSVRVPCDAPATAIHLLSGVSGWGFPLGTRGSVSMIVRLHYEDGTTEDHPLRNGEHFADYIRRVDVPGSKFAFPLRDQQIRYLAVHPKRSLTIAAIEFVKGPDETAPIVMAVTVEAE